MKKKSEKGFTLIEMLITITVLGIVMPLLFNVINSSFKELRKMESIQMKNIVESRLINRLEEDFRTHTKFKFMTADSIGFYTTRDQLFQQEVSYFIADDVIYYRVDDSDKKVLVKNVNTLVTEFEYYNYDNTVKSPENSDSFIIPEMNTMPKIRLNYQFTLDENIVSNHYIKVRRLN